LPSASAYCKRPRANVTEAGIIRFRRSGRCGCRGEYRRSSAGPCRTSPSASRCRHRR